MNSGSDKLSSQEAMDASAAAFVTAQASGQDPVAAANSAFKQNATADAQGWWTDTGDTVSEGSK
jgi:hypothetical protein